MTIPRAFVVAVVVALGPPLSLCARPAAAAEPVAPSEDEPTSAEPPAGEPSQADDPLAVSGPPVRKPVSNYQGTLRERGTRQPLAGVLVTIFRKVEGKSVGFEATTDASGNFAFYDLEPAQWRVGIESPGFFPFRTKEEIRTKEAVTVTYYVERGNYNPYDVTSTTNRPRKEVSRTVLSADELQTVPGSGGDPLAAIQNLSGVAHSAASGELVVRGSGPEDTKVLVDGIVVPTIYHFGGLRSVLPLRLVEGIEFYPGNFSVEYGGSTGGVIDVATRRVQPPRVGGSVDVSFQDAGVFLEAPFGDTGGIALGVRRSYLDDVMAAAVPTDASVNTIASPRYYDYQLLANYRPTLAHDLRLFLFGSDDKLQFLFQNPALIDVNSQSSAIIDNTHFYRVVASYRYTHSDRLQNTLRYSEGRDSIDSGFGQVVSQLNTATTQVRDVARLKVFDSLHLMVGADVIYRSENGLVRAPRAPKEGEPPTEPGLERLITSQIKDRTTLGTAGFLEAEWTPLEGLLLVPGLRLDVGSRLKQATVQRRLTMRWQANARIALKAGAGSFLQEPQDDEIDKNFGNPSLRPETALHYSAGVEWRPWGRLTFDVTGFYKDLSDLVVSTQAVRTSNGIDTPLIYDNSGRGKVIGAEAVIRQEFGGRFYGWLAYTHSRSTRRNSPGAEERLFDQDQTHVLNAVGTVELPNNWRIGARYRWASGNPSTPILNAVFNASSDRYTPVFGRTNSTRAAPFHQFDVRTEKRFVFENWMMTAFLDVQNAYNHANAQGAYYSFDYKIAKPVQGIPIIIIGGLRADF